MSHRREIKQQAQFQADHYSVMDRIFCECGKPMSQHEPFGEPSWDIGCRGFREAAEQPASVDDLSGILQRSIDKLQR